MEERCRYERYRGQGWRGTAALVMTSNGRASSGLFLIRPERRTKQGFTPGVSEMERGVSGVGGWSGVGGCFIGGAAVRRGVMHGSWG
jgi:hypothetical protein